MKTTLSQPAARVRADARCRFRRTLIVSVFIGLILLGVAALSLMAGRTFYTPGEVAAVILGGQPTSASFTVGQLRLPRVITGVLAGFAFGAAGATFQSMLRNPLASPDIIGVSTGAGAFAVIGIITLSLGETAASFFALGGALLTAAAIYLLSNRRGFTSVRFILIGIGIAAMMQSLISYVLTRAPSFEIQAAMQWLTGSLNGSSWEKLPPLLIAFAACVPVLIASSRGLDLLRLGDATATALGVPVRFARVTVILASVALLAFATAATGPIAFVAFMSGPIAARLVSPGANLTVPAGLVGALLVLISDFAGQYLFGTKYPVGVITGLLGAPYLILLLIRMNRTGSTI
ncbi:iron chelate uptake ABC transporter family permease subunit [Leucobacter sp. CSA2]|uniref:Iron chelate uptake ABC transporter family permease subunit n=1 Tax=Leucobacter edaphi TaxID=2796472 RepID=A0A934QDI8_9MICO|nr:iron chelate uptake ABC transporter family permease subunit [Leucobacter edaphi]MBK0421810.1 iron chelate uptake ABC transporter family permease subunit [Leucobacter edaphi]